MIIALDSYYQGDICNTSLVLFSKKEDKYIYTDTIYTTVTSPYIPGMFYLRELPGIKLILSKFKFENPEWWDSVDTIIVDSFYKLKKDDKIWDGLGSHLFNWLVEFNNQKHIVSVAKNPFGECEEISELVYRGGSQKPLFVQSSGDASYDADMIENELHGNYRIPTMLKIVDQLSRKFPI